MPIPMVLTSSDNRVGGQKYNRFGGPVYSGQIADNGSGGPLPAPGAIALIQSTAPLLTQLLSTTPASIARGAFVYIPQTSGGVATSSFASLESAVPYTAQGAALLWTGSKLAVYSTVTGSGVWLMSAAFTSSA